MEKERKDALEMEEKKNEKGDESKEAEERMMGAWCSQASSRAPVRG